MWLRCIISDRPKFIKAVDSILMKLDYIKIDEDVTKIVTHAYLHYLRNPGEHKSHILVTYMCFAPFFLLLFSGLLLYLPFLYNSFHQEVRFHRTKDYESPDSLYTKAGDIKYFLLLTGDFAVNMGK